MRARGLILLTTTTFLAVSSVRCVKQDAGPGPVAASGGQSTGGSANGAGGVIVGSGGTGTGGAAISGTGGTTSGSGGTGGGNKPATGGVPGTGGSGVGGSPKGSGGAGGAGNFDDGRLFTDAAVAMSSGGTTGADAAVSGSADAGSDAPPGSGHVATCSIPLVGLTAVFTQTGTDVTVVVTATKCPQGAHVLQIHDGFSCDSAATQGGVWGGKRGDGIGSLTCNAAQQGTLTYTRPGTDPATNWTVGDHSTKTDVTLHPMLLDTNCGTFF
jgi:hypothetical protein